MIEGLRIAADLIVMTTALVIVVLIVFSRLITAMDRSMPGNKDQ